MMEYNIVYIHYIYILEHGYLLYLGVYLAAHMYGYLSVCMSNKEENRKEEEAKEKEQACG